MIDHSLKTGHRATAPRPYHQKMTVEVTRKALTEPISASTKALQFTAPKIPSVQDSNAPSPDSSAGGFEESFARMMVNLGADYHAGKSGTDDADVHMSKDFAARTPLAGIASSASRQIKADQNNDLLSASLEQPEAPSAKNDFMDYMNQTDAEKLRQEMTGVTKEQYDQMSPEEKLAVDQKMQQLLKKKQEIAEVALKAKIAMAKATDNHAV